MPSFENFFSDDSIGSYLRNPFGEDFIKLEIDQNNFRTNKSKVIMVLVIGDDDDDDGKTVWLDLLNLDHPSPNPHHPV